MPKYRRIAGSDDKASAAEMLEEIFDLLVDRFGYRLRPWHSDRSFQRIRSVDQVLAEGGTCIDIALLTASVCLSSYLQPYVVLAEGGDKRRHVFLAVSEKRDDTRMSAWAPKPSSDVEFVSGDDMPTYVSEHELLLFDSTDVTVRGMTFDRLMDRSKAIVLGGPEGENYIKNVTGYWLVDIRACHEQFDSDSLYRPFPEDSRVSTYLPELTTNFVRYGSRIPVLEKLSYRVQSGGYTIVRGPAGVGKSLLALEVAKKTDSGCGWFLDASSTSALERSMAAAELAEQGSSGLLIDDRESLAKVARNRLQTSKQPWVLVIDNANEDFTSDYKELLPTPSENQVVIVTTTNKTWDVLSDHEPVLIEALTKDDLEALIPAGVVPATHGLPLLVSAVAALPDGTDMSRLATDLSDVATAQRLLRMAREDHADPHKIDGFLAVAGWLPAAGFPLAHVDTWVESQLIDWLAGRSLIQTSGDHNSIRFHRTFGAALRDLYADSGTTSALAILTAPEAVDLLDESTLEELSTLVGFLPSGAGEEQGDVTTAVVGHAYHTLAKVKELHGDQKSSSNYFQTAAGWLGEQTSYRLLLADCNHGIARRLFQGDNPELEKLDEATRLVATAQEICAEVSKAAIDAQERSEALMAGARSLALEGLIERKRAKHRFDRSLDDRANLSKSTTGGVGDRNGSARKTRSRKRR